MFSLLPKLDFSETVNTLLSYAVIVTLSLTIVIFGMRVERHLIGRDCENESKITIESREYQCRPYKKEE